ncbi:MAG: hypothetical protein ABGX17_08115, partial [Desulfurobacteriaceae bacterium]
IRISPLLTSSLLYFFQSLLMLGILPHISFLDTAILDSLARENKLDKRVVNTLKNNLEKVEVSRKTAQSRARELYDSLRNLVKEFTRS